MLKFSGMGFVLSISNFIRHLRLAIMAGLSSLIRRTGSFRNKENKTNGSQEDIVKDSKAFPDKELQWFISLIYNIKLLGHEDNRFQHIALKAFDIISKCGETENFFDEVSANIENEHDFASEIIKYIVAQKKSGVSDIDIIKNIRNKYISRPAVNAAKHNVMFRSETGITPVYIESEMCAGSRQLNAKSKLSHKHKALQYANIIGGKLAEEYENSSEKSFYKYIRAQCNQIASSGNLLLTSEDFEPSRNQIATYKKRNDNHKSPSIQTNIITPEYHSDNSQVESLLNILDKLTFSRLPRYEVPALPSYNNIVQREYKKTNPFDVYNDLVAGEYTEGSLKDKRFSILYQLILYISECLENGFSEEETIDAISSLRVVKKKDIQTLRNRQGNFIGLTKAERKLVLDSEICNDIDMSLLYANLIHQYHKTRQNIGLNYYISGVLLKNYKNSSAAWRLLKYIYLKDLDKDNEYIVNNRSAISESYEDSKESSCLNDVYLMYYLLEPGLNELKKEYEHSIDMTRYNFDRDHITIEMLTVQTLKKYIPKRFDSKGRLCRLIRITPIEAELFKEYDIKAVNENIYGMFPIFSLTTKDIYDLLMIVVKQKRMIEPESH